MLTTNNTICCRLLLRSLVFVSRKNSQAYNQGPLAEKKTVCPRQDLNPEQPTLTVLVTGAKRCATWPPHVQVKIALPQNAVPFASQLEFLMCSVHVSSSDSLNFPKKHGPSQDSSSVILRPRKRAEMTKKFNFIIVIDNSMYSLHRQNGSAFVNKTQSIQCKLIN